MLRILIHDISIYMRSINSLTFPLLWLLNASAGFEMQELEIGTESIIILLKLIDGNVT